MRIRPYILAGGRSSRMGQDKASMYLGGRTLLGRSVETFRGVAAFEDLRGGVTVTVVGERSDLHGADRVIADRYPGCGPLGGMQAALTDLHCGGEADWAFFLPVDMPFLTSKAIKRLLDEWIEAAQSGAYICHVEANGTPQPLVSLIHRAVRPFMDEALTAGQFKVTPVLQSAAQLLAQRTTDKIGSGLHMTQAYKDVLNSAGAGQSASGEAEEMKRLWFSNLNTEEEFSKAETFIASMG